jgi:glucose-6-phosphate isomerase
VISQVFYLPQKIIEKVENPDESSLNQSIIDKSIITIKQQCDLDSASYELINIEANAKLILSKFKKAIIIAIGGALLASRAYTASCNYESSNFKLIYSDSLNKQKLDSIFTIENLIDSAIIIISRSGSSVETIAQSKIIINKYRQYFGQDYDLGKYFFIITKGKNKLSFMGKEIKAHLIEYTNNSGKFSSFSIAALLPARLINLNPKEIILGAKQELSSPENAILAAKINFILLKNDYSINVISYYNDLFDQICSWYSQISSEIIAKSKKGFIPLIAKGVFDQHGLWQALFAGKQDKYFTFIINKIEYEDINSKIEKSYHKITLNRLKCLNHPARELIIDQINSQNLGALAMQFLLEFTLIANLRGISPLSQPFINKNKRLLKDII